MRISSLASPSSVPSSSTPSFCSDETEENRLLPSHDDHHLYLSDSKFPLESTRWQTALLKIEKKAREEMWEWRKRRADEEKWKEDVRDLFLLLISTHFVVFDVFHHHFLLIFFFLNSLNIPFCLPLSCRCFSRGTKNDVLSLQIFFHSFLELIHFPLLFVFLSLSHFQNFFLPTRHPLVI